MLEKDSIFVAGMPRAGSMWTYNVARQLITLAGKAPWPEQVPPDERPAIEEALSKPAGPGRVYCIKTHFAIPTDRKNIKIICNFRDIRDATLSFMRFMKCPFATALESARESMKITDYYLRSGSRSVMPVDYDDVVGASSSAVAKIADFIGVQASDNEINRIAHHLSRERVAVRLEKLAIEATGHPGTIATGSNTQMQTRLRNVDGSYRVLDYKTGFQTGHITSSQTGEWREAFTAEQQYALNKLLGDWLLRYGFDV